MTAFGIVESRAKLERIRETLKAGRLNSIRSVLPDEAVEAACETAGFEYRKRLLTPVVVVLHMILAAIWPEESFAASWQVMWNEMISRQSDLQQKPPGSGTVSKARSRIPLEVWDKIFLWVVRQIQKLSADVDEWRGHRVVLVDGTTVSMPDEPELFEAFGRGSGGPGGKKYRYPLARLVTLGLANTMTVMSYRLGGYTQSESELLESQSEALKAGDLLVGDRHFAGAHYYARHTLRGVQFLTRLHQRIKLRRIKPVAINGKGDFIAELKLNKKHRRLYPELPEVVTVRMIRVAVRIRGRRRVVWLATSLLDAGRYPADEIAQLYAQRWRIETFFRQVKVNLGADVLRSQSADGVRKEVAARLVAVNIIRAIMLQAALKHGVDPMRVSFIHAVRAILAFAPAFGSEPLGKRRSIWEAMLAQIAWNLVPERPGRIEPRAVTRERKHYPKLRTTRREWRLSHVA